MPGKLSPAIFSADLQEVFSRVFEIKMEKDGRYDELSCWTSLIVD